MKFLATSGIMLFSFGIRLIPIGFLKRFCTTRTDSHDWCCLYIFYTNSWQHSNSCFRVLINFRLLQNWYQIMSNAKSLGSTSPQNGVLRDFQVFLTSFGLFSAILTKHFNNLKSVCKLAEIMKKNTIESYNCHPGTDCS